MNDAAATAAPEARRELAGVPSVREVGISPIGKRSLPMGTRYAPSSEGDKE
jgi:hypothetical protein